MCGCENKPSTCIQLPSDISPYFSVDKYFSELNTEEKRNTARINLGLNNEVGIDVTAYLDAGSMNISDMISEILKVMEKVGKRFIPVVYYDDSDALIGEITDGDLDTFIGSALKLDNNITLNLDNIKGKAEIVFIKENSIWRVYSKSFVETVDPNDITLLESSVSNISSKIPSQATSSNQLADKNFVNSSISTATATFRDSYNLITDLNLSLNATPKQKEDALGCTVATADNNDYAFILIPTSTLTPAQIKTVERYKYSTDNKWHFEYELNNSGFTANQWATINSGITATDVANYDAGLEQLENKYEKPTGGIPVEDLDNSVQVNLGKANTAVQPGDLGAYVSYQTQTGKTDVQKTLARTNIDAASQSDLNNTNIRVSNLETTKATAINLYEYIGLNKILPVEGAYTYYYNERETEYPNLNKKINIVVVALPIDDENGHIKESSNDYDNFYVWYDSLFQEINIWHSDGEYYGTYTEQDDRGSGNYRNSQDQQLPYVVLRALNIGNVSVMGSSNFSNTQKVQARTNIGAASTDVATTSANGLMSSTDKTVLDNAVTALNEKADKTTVRENERVVAEALNDLESRKVDKVEGKGLSTNDFSDEYKETLGHININDSDNTLEINNDSNNINLNTEGDIYVGNGYTNKVEINAGSGSVAISSYQDNIVLQTSYNGGIRLLVDNESDAIVLSVDGTELTLNKTNIQKLNNLLQNS